MAKEIVDQAAIVHPPHLHRFIVATSDNRSTIGSQSQTIDWPLVAHQHLQQISRSHIPDPNCAINPRTNYKIPAAEIATAWTPPVAEHDRHELANRLGALSGEATAALL